MIILDAYISPALALWIISKYHIECCSAHFLGLRNALDKDIFFKARELNATVITKDDDFVTLLDRHGSPPKVIWLTCGNTSKARLQNIFEANLINAIELLSATNLVEITGY